MQFKKISINDEQRLYVIKNEVGITCLGFDVCEARRAAYCKWLYNGGHDSGKVKVGTLEAYDAYLSALHNVIERCKKTGERCNVELTHELIGFEGRRVEITYPSGEKHRFKVGMSTGYVPVHIELSNSRSTDGGAVYFPKGSTVRVVR